MANSRFISRDNLRELIKKQLKGKLENNDVLNVLKMADTKYYLTPLGKAKEIILKSKVNKKIWVSKQYFDCDDYALVLKAHFAEASYESKIDYAHCFGIAWGMLPFPFPHSLNWMVNDDKKLRFVEPRSDKIFMPRTKDKNIYFMLV